MAATRPSGRKCGKLRHRFPVPSYNPTDAALTSLAGTRTTPNPCILTDGIADWSTVTGGGEVRSSSIGTANTLAPNLRCMWRATLWA